MVESRAESCILRQESQEFDVLLIAAPILSWSRFTIPTATLPAAPLATLKVHLGAHVLAAGARLALCDYLFSPDQLPRSFADTRQLVAQLGLRALAGEDLAVDTRNLPETNRFLSDTRYLLGAVVVPRGQGLFFWNENDGNREVALSQWQSQAGPTLEPLMPGCAWEMVLPDAYHAACRAADRLSRPYSLRASVAFLQTVLNAPADQLHVAMDGDMAPLDTLYELAEKYDAWLVIDDAHGFGVLGPHGQGSTGHFGLPPSGRVLYMIAPPIADLEVAR